MTRARIGLRRWAPPVIFLVALVCAWQAYVVVAHVDPWELPSPSAIWSAGFGARGVLAGHVWTTVQETAWGLLAGGAAGVGLAVIVSWVPFVRRVVWPLVVTSQTVPIIVLAPLLTIWFGYGIMPKVVVVALVVFFPIAVSTTSGLAGADEEQIDLVRSFGASPSQIMRLVRIPAALPEMLAGLRISASYAVAGAVVGEYVGGQSGLGIFIDRSKASYQTDQMFAGVAVIALLSITAFLAVQLLERLLMPWRRSTESAIDKEL